MYVMEMMYPLFEGADGIMVNTMIILKHGTFSSAFIKNNKKKVNPVSHRITCSKAKTMTLAEPD